MLLHIVSVYDDAVEAVLKGAHGNTSLTLTIVDCLVPKQCMNIWLFSVPDHNTAAVELQVRPQLELFVKTKNILLVCHVMCICCMCMYMSFSKVFFCNLMTAP